MRTPKPISSPTSAMISPKPAVIASSVATKPTPVTSPRYSEPMISEITGLTLTQMISRTTRTMAIAVCRATTEDSSRGVVLP